MNEKEKLESIRQTVCLIQNELEQKLLVLKHIFRIEGKKVVSKFDLTLERLQNLESMIQKMAEVDKNGRLRKSVV